MVKKYNIPTIKLIYLKILHIFNLNWIYMASKQEVEVYLKELKVKMKIFGISI
ncbi:hypothetical protein JCM15548_14611 [Geofilum rubicundum JCM 15548]|uniref:Uncharacterized protein n=1 Tax=Geofilum rubicundum JCM 15548 TaxID=1236989 RepID=A0A0E9LRI3_9BACT|nr:hypothetical protein JCM15548_14611 [Geofilum rubicundum JCM 15548]